MASKGGTKTSGREENRYKDLLVREYRIVLPMTVDEYQVAQLWSVAEASKNETGGGEGIEVLQNRPFDFRPENLENDKSIYKELGNGKYLQGQYTHKIYHLQSRVPSLIKLFLPDGAMEIHEHAWNAYPFCLTEVTNPRYMKDSFLIRIETMHCDDRGTQDNAHGLKDYELTKVDKKVDIDIANDPVSASDYKAEWDPKLYRPERTEICRGPLEGAWKEKVEPVMCAYKLVSCKFKWKMIQNKVENYIHKQEKRIFTNFHRQVYCWMDKWYGLTMDDIRRIEEKTKADLDEQRKCGEIRGTKVDD